MVMKMVMLLVMRYNEAHRNRYRCRGGSGNSSRNDEDDVASRVSLFCLTAATGKDVSTNEKKNKLPLSSKVIDQVILHKKSIVQQEWRSVLFLGGFFSGFFYSQKEKKGV